MPNGFSIALKALNRSTPLNDDEVLKQIKMNNNKINVWTCTWNMHAKSWPENLSEALFSGDKTLYHVIVMGTQECQRSIMTSAFLPSKWMWETSIQTSLGERYVMVRSQTMQAVRLFVS